MHFRQLKISQQPGLGLGTVLAQQAGVGMRASEEQRSGIENIKRAVGGMGQAPQQRLALVA